MPRRLLLVAALLLLVPPAAAQVDTCDMTASVNPPRLQHAPGEALVYNFTVALGQAGGGDVEVVVEAVTPGWTATVAPASFPGLAAGDQATAEVLVNAPGADGTRQAQVTITATLTCPAGGGLIPIPAPPQTHVESQVLSPAMVLTAAGGPAPTGPGLDGSALLVLGGLAVIGIAGAAAVLLRPKGLVVKVPEPERTMPPGGGASFPVQVENRAADPIEAVVRVLGVPDTWRLIAPPTEVSLKPGASTTVQVLVRSPADARPGETAGLQVQLIERGSGRLRQVDLVARIAGAEERPDVVVRDERELAKERPGRRAP